MIISPLTSLTTDLYSFADVVVQVEKELCAKKCMTSTTVTKDNLDKAETDEQHYLCLIYSFNIPASRFFIEHALLRREHAT